MITSQNWILLDRHKEKRLEHEAWVERVDGNKVAFVRSKLQHRDFEILKWLHKLKIMTSDQVAKLLFSKKESGEDILNPNKVCNVRLKKLYAWGCVDRFWPAPDDGKGTAPAHYVLAKVGARLLELEGFRGMSTLSQRWRHTVAGNDVLTHYATQYRLRAWRHEFPIEWYDGHSKCSMMPDAFTIYVDGKHEHFEMIEVDMGTENLKVLHDKLKQYNRYLNSDACRDGQWQIYAEKDIYVKPRVVFYMNNDRRVKQLKQYVSGSDILLDVVIKHLNEIK